MIILAPFVLVIGPREVIQKLSFRGVWNVVLDLVLFEVPGDAGSLGNQFADVAAIRAKRALFVEQHFLQLQAVGFAERLIENRTGNFKTNEVMVAVRSVAFLGDLQNVEAKLGLHVSQPAVFIRNAVTVFFAQARVENRNRAIGAEAVPVVVRGVMGKGADGKSVFIQVFRVTQECQDEIAAADVMREVTEKGAAVRVVAHILNNGAAVGIGLSPAQIFFGGLGKLFQQ